MGCVFNIQRFSVHDGPGIRTNIFLKGCPLNCLWCHNPEGLSSEPQVKYSPLKCIGCGECVKVCEPHGHSITDGIHTLDFTKCISCMECIRVCPASAMERYGNEMSVDDVMKEVLRDKGFYNNSGGGLTISGGEPLYQGEFATELLKRAKAEGIDTAVETCGMVATETMKAAAEYTDLFLYDYKITGEEEHKKYTGASQKQILLNLEMLKDNKVILRCPIIPGINDNDTHYRGIADTANRNKHITEINIMPYHSFGDGKRTSLGMEIKYQNKTMKSNEAEIIAEKVSRYTDIPVKLG